MKIISILAHGVLDYAMGVLLIFSPWIFRFSSQPSATGVVLVLGVMAFIYSLLTNYELGLFKVIPMKAHLALDLLSGAFLALSPWILGFAGAVYLPHLVLGLAEIVAVIMTDPVPHLQSEVKRA